MPSTIDPSLIDPTKPEQGEASTANVRANESATQTNFTRARDDFNAQEAVVDGHIADPNPHSDSASDADVAAAITTHDDSGSAHGGVEAAFGLHDGAGGTTHPAATGAVAGFMSTTDKSKLDGVEDNANAGVPDVATADGDLLSYDGTQYTKIGVGAPGQLLTARPGGGVGAKLIWEEPPATGGSGTVQDVAKDGSVIVSDAVQLDFRESGNASVTVFDAGAGVARITVDATAGSGGGGIGKGTPFAVGELMEISSDAGDGQAISAGLTAATINGHIGSASNPHTVTHAQTSPPAAEHVGAATAGTGMTHSAGVLNVGAGDGIAVGTDDVAVDATVARRDANNVYSPPGNAAVEADYFQTGQVGQSGRFRLESSSGFWTLTGRNDAGTQVGDALMGVAHPSNIAAQGTIIGNAAFPGAGALNVENDVQRGGASLIANVVEDTAPQLGGKLDSNGNLISLAAAGTVKGGIQAEPVDNAAIFAYYDGTNPPDGADGGLRVEPGRAVLGGTVRALTLQHSVSDGRQVYVTQSGDLYGVDPPAPAWSQVDTDTGDYNLGQGDTQGPEVQITGLAVSPDTGDTIEIGEEYRVQVSIWIALGDGGTPPDDNLHDKPGAISVAVGINGTVDATTWLQRDLGPYFNAQIVKSFTRVADAQITDADTVHVWARREASEDSNANPWVWGDSATQTHTVTLQKLATGGGGVGTGDVIQGTISGAGTGYLAEWEDWGAKTARARQLTDYAIDLTPTTSTSSMIFQNGPGQPIERTTIDIAVLSVFANVTTTRSAQVNADVGYTATLQPLTPGAAEVPTPSTGQYRELQTGGTTAWTVPLMTEVGFVAWSFEALDFNLDTSNYRVTGAPVAAGGLATIVFKNFGAGPQLADWQNQ